MPCSVLSSSPNVSGVALHHQCLLVCRSDSGVTVITVASQAVDLGSIPGCRKYMFFIFISQTANAILLTIIFDDEGLLFAQQHQLSPPSWNNTYS